MKLFFFFLKLIFSIYSYFRGATSPEYFPPMCGWHLYLCVRNYYNSTLDHRTLSVHYPHLVAPYDPLFGWHILLISVGDVFHLTLSDDSLPRTM